jgi:peroxin-4
MDPVSKRLMKELVDFEKEANSHPEILSLYPADDDDLLTWKAQIAGLPNTPYEGKGRNQPTTCNPLLISLFTDGIFDLLIKVPTNYPMQPPTIIFTSVLCHPNVHIKVR